LEAVPGLGYGIVRRSVLENCEGNAHSLSLDLDDQWCALEANGPWCFTPPIHVIASLHQALRGHEEEAGVEGRGRRYIEKGDVLIAGMRELGFEALSSDELRALIIITFHMPATRVSTSVSSTPNWRRSVFLFIRAS